MPDRDTVVRGLHDIAGFIAGRIGIEQARNFLRTIDDVIALLKEQDETISNLNETVKNLLQQIMEIKEYMTPIGKVKDVKAYDAMMNEQETELCDRCGWVRLKSSRIAESR